MCLTGICFDMGHYAWYTSMRLGNPQALPPKEFLDRIVHTHIHECVNGDTHYPVSTHSEPTESYINAIAENYPGVYNLELSPEKFKDFCTAEEGYFGSLEALRDMMPFKARVYEEIKLNFDKDFSNALGITEHKEGCYFSLIGPSSYLFNTNGYLWGMDIAFRKTWELAEVPSRIAEHLGCLDLIMLTHGHVDHMEKSTICALAQTEITWLVPEFLMEDVLSYGVKPERIITAHVGDVIKAGPLTVKVRSGSHFRPDTGKGIISVGYVVDAADLSTIAFPGDVRDYKLTDKDPLCCDWCFGHIWLTDDASNPQKYLPKCDEFAEFMLSMSEKNIFLTHLYESARVEKSTWQVHHAQAAGEAIRRRSPKTVTIIPKRGEIFKLTK